MAVIQEEQPRTRIAPIDRAAMGLPDADGEPVYYRVKRHSRASAVRMAPTHYWRDEAKLNRFPPAAENTPMVLCESGHLQCAKMYPFYYGAGCTCVDCNENRKQSEHAARWRKGLVAGQRSDQIPDEPQMQSLVDEADRAADLTREAETLAEMEARGVRLEDPTLPSEDLSDLAAEIEYARATDSYVTILADGTVTPAEEPPPPAL